MPGIGDDYSTNARGAATGLAAVFGLALGLSAALEPTFAARSARGALQFGSGIAVADVEKNRPALLRPEGLATGENGSSEEVDD